MGSGNPVTLVTALKKGLPFGYHLRVTSPTTVGPYYNCHGGYVPPFPVINAEGAQGAKTYTIYDGTVGSINAFYATLEQRVGLCDVVRTAASFGMTRADGTSLLRHDPHLPKSDDLSVDNYPSFTLGSVYVSPMKMAAAYATLAARGVYCRPIAIRAITAANGAGYPVEQARCHRVISQGVADAANYVLQAVLGPGGTADGRSIGIPAAAKTGTANGGYYAAFAGYTPRLAGYVSVFNPQSPTGRGRMVYPRANYREVNGSLGAPSQMFGDNAPGATWQLTFLSLHLRPKPFVYPPTYPYFDLPLIVQAAEEEAQVAEPVTDPDADAARPRPRRPPVRAPRPRRRRHAARARHPRISRRPGVRRPSPSRSTATAGSEVLAELLQLGRRAVSRVEDAEHAHHRRPGVLQAVRQPRRQMHARSGGQRMLGTADVRHPLARQDQHYLVIWVAVIGRPARRDLADELGGHRAAATGTEHDAELPVARRLDLAVGEVTARRRARRPGRLAAGGRSRQRHDVQAQVAFGAGLTRYAAPGGIHRPRSRAQRQARLAVHVQLAVPVDDEPQLAARARRAIESRSAPAYPPAGGPGQARRTRCRAASGPWRRPRCGRPATSAALTTTPSVIAARRSPHPPRGPGRWLATRPASASLNRSISSSVL